MDSINNFLLLFVRTSMKQTTMSVLRVGGLFVQIACVVGGKNTGEWTGKCQSSIGTAWRGMYLSPPFSTKRASVET
jgi:hypothetical protein